MRITGGTARGRTLTSLKSSPRDVIRPTSDRVREAIFSILGRQVVDASVLDLFAGTGSLGLEALSRGAASAVFVDSSSKSLAIVQANIALCFPDTTAYRVRLDLSRRNSFNLLRKNRNTCGPFSLVFMDPPYGRDLAQLTLTMVAKSGLLAPDALVVTEEKANQALPDHFGPLRLMTTRRYGDTGIWLFRWDQKATEMTEG